MPNLYPLYGGGPLNRELSEAGAYRTGSSTPPPLGSTGTGSPTVQTGGPLPPSTISVGTGGGLPPSLQNVQTGGPLPPSVTPSVQTGGPLPPGSISVGTGGVDRPYPVTPPVQGGFQTPPRTGGPLPPQQAFGQGGPAGQPGGQVSGFSPVDVINQMVNGLMNGYIGQNARRQGMEYANQRGLLNSSIAAGNSQRAALEALNPYVDQGMGLLRQREQNAFEGEQSDKKVFQQDWLNSRDFNRQFYGALSMIPINNAAQFSQLIAQYALDNPEVYTPDNIAGMSQFFNSNFRQIMSQYLGDINLGGA